MSVVKNSRSWPLKNRRNELAPLLIKQPNKHKEMRLTNFFPSTIPSSYMQFHQIWWSILEVQLILSLWDSNPIFLQISIWFQAHSDLVLCIIWSFSNRNILFFYFFFQLSKDALSILHEVWHFISSLLLLCCTSSLPFIFVIVRLYL